MTTTDAPLSSNQLAQARTDLAGMRTLMAADRTLMAWVRTSLSMQSFGFTLYKILQAVQEQAGTLPREQTPRNVGVFLTTMALVAMVMGMMEYRQTCAALRPLHDVPRLRPSLLMALLMSALAVLLFIGIVTRLL